jgi:hypothetical protein
MLILFPFVLLIHLHRSSCDRIARVPCFRGASLGGAVRWDDILLAAPPSARAAADSAAQRAMHAQRSLTALMFDQLELSRFGVDEFAPLGAAIARRRAEIAALNPKKPRMVSTADKSLLLKAQLSVPPWWEAEGPPTVAASPLDEFNSVLSALPTAADSLNVIAHYIQCTDGHNHSADVVDWAAHALRGALTAAIGEESAATERRVLRYVDRVLSGAHDHSGDEVDERPLGTLIIIARATHRTRRAYSPRIFDGARLIESWNSLVNESASAIPTNVDDVIAAWRAAASGPSDPARIGVVVGASYASSFIGMIHFTSERNVQRRDMEQHAQSVRAVVDFANRVQTSLGRFGFARDESVMKRVHEASRIRSLHTRIGAMARGVALPQLPQPTRSPSATSKNATTTKKEQQWRERKSKPRSQHDTRSKLRGRSYWVGGAMMSWVRSSVHGESSGSQPKLDDMSEFMSLFDTYVKAARDATDGAPHECDVLVLSRSDVLREWATALRDNGVERTEAPCDCQIDDGCAFVEPDSDG